MYRQFAQLIFTFCTKSLISVTDLVWITWTANIKHSTKHIISFSKIMVNSGIKIYLNVVYKKLG